MVLGPVKTERRLAYTYGTLNVKVVLLYQFVGGALHFSHSPVLLVVVVDKKDFNLTSLRGKIWLTEMFAIRLSL